LALVTGNLDAVGTLTRLSEIVGEVIEGISLRTGTAVSVARTEDDVDDLDE
jgi:hypothetical protein